MDIYTEPQWSQSALLTIDVQRDFSREGAVLYIPGTQEAAVVMEGLTEAYREARRPIIHIVRLYLEDGSNADLCRRAMIEGGARLAVPGTEGSQLMEELLPSPEVTLDPDRLLAGDPQQIGDHEWILYKSRWSAFHKTRLKELLDGLEVTTVVVAGCNYPNCPRATIYDAVALDFRTVMVKDAISGVYDRGLEEIRNIGVTIASAEEVIRQCPRVSAE